MIEEAPEEPLPPIRIGLAGDDTLMISSRNIAEILTTPERERRHSDVLKTIRGMMKKSPDGNSRSAFLECTYKDQNNQDRPEILLNEKKAMALLMFYSTVVGERVMDEL